MGITASSVWCQSWHFGVTGTAAEEDRMVGHAAKSKIEAEAGITSGPYASTWLSEACGCTRFRGGTQDMGYCFRVTHL